ncbi:MAG: AEC family transporter [Eubacteriales bacterium]|nr:AEC family transporter [Eubacteriales bacterium]
MDISILITQMQVFAAMIVAGVFMQRTGIIRHESINGMGNVLTGFIIPCQMLTMMPNGGSSAEVFRSANIVICSFGYILGMVFISIIVSRFIGIKDKAHRNMHALISACGNAGFIGSPLAMMMYPAETVANAIYVIVEAFTCWTIGPLLADPKTEFRISSLKRLVSPIIVSLLIGFALTLLNIHPAGFVPWDALTAVGATSKYLSTFYIGLKVGEIGFLKLIEEKRIVIASAFKLVIFPVLLYLVIGRTDFLTPGQLGVIMLMACTPTPISAPLIAQLTNGDTDYAMAGTLINTILCIFTIPMVMKLIGI